MPDSTWTIRDVNALTRRAFEVLAARNGLNGGDFLQLLLVEYATSKVLPTQPDPDEAVGRSKPAREKSCGQDDRQRLGSPRFGSQREDDRIEIEEPTSEEIADWIRRLDSKKSEKKVLQLSNDLFWTWLAGNPGKQPAGPAWSATAP